MSFRSPPAAASWLHQEARSGFEVAYFAPAGDGWGVDGTTAAVEDGQTWVVTCRIELDADWVTRRARVQATTEAGRWETTLESDGAGHWRVDGIPAAELDGCLDVDLESSAMTNAFPVHRLRLAEGDQATAPAACIRVPGLLASRLEQTYRRVPVSGAPYCYEYAAPALGFTSRLVVDQSGLVIDYPGIARRAS
jgi:uncharacterized protein